MMDPQWVPAVNDRFSTFADLEHSMKQYQAMIKKEYRRQNGHKINDDKLVFHSLTYACKCHGTHETVGSRPSKKCGCPSTIRLSLSKENNTNYLEIIKLNLEHNEKCNSIQKECCMNKKKSIKKKDLPMNDRHDASAQTLIKVGGVENHENEDTTANSLPVAQEKMNATILQDKADTIIANIDPDVVELNDEDVDDSMQNMFAEFYEDELKSLESTKGNVLPLERKMMKELCYHLHWK